MPLDFMHRLGVPAFHPFCRQGVLAWWFVPRKYEPDFFAVLEHIWTHVLSSSTHALILSYFELILPSRDFPVFSSHLNALVQSLDDFIESGEPDSSYE